MYTTKCAIGVQIYMKISVSTLGQTRNNAPRCVWPLRSSVK